MYAASTEIKPVASVRRHEPMSRMAGRREFYRLLRHGWEEAFQVGRIIFGRDDVNLSYRVLSQL